tara:strand:+ start:6601 stop:7311 length:711 start_codon:yes stop_codon:yes gene_type:complete
MTDTIISKDCIKRILKDLSNLDSKLLEQNNIYYSHDEDNILKGYIMIIGPKDTLYENGYYFFHINFTTSYPFKPPKVIFKTCDGVTRFHPNLYRNGKVCLSILNTWRGESWSACQTLSTILMTLVTLFTNEPFLNEPGIKNTHHQYENYHNIIHYKNIYHSILHYIDPINLPINYEIFYPIICENFKKNKKRILEICENKMKTNKINSVYHVNLYNMVSSINYTELHNKISDKEIE